MPNLLLPTGKLRPCHSGGPFLLGAALVILDLPRLGDNFALAAVAAEHPWMPVAIHTPPSRDDRALIRAWRAHPSLKGMLELSGPEELVAGALRKTIRDEGRPSPDEVARYIASRCDHPKFSEALVATLFDRSAPPKSTRYDVFRRTGPLTGKHWVAAFRLMQAVSLPGSLSIHSAAAFLGIDGRTLNTYRRELLCLNWLESRSRFGWRWVAEEILRKHGYLGAHGGPRPLPVRNFA